MSGKRSFSKLDDDFVGVGCNLFVLLRGFRFRLDLCAVSDSRGRFSPIRLFGVDFPFEMHSSSPACDSRFVS